MAQTHTEQWIEDAIATSICEDRVPDLRVTVDTSEYVDACAALGARCEEWAHDTARLWQLDTDAVIDVRDYWGVDEDGDDWRITLIVER